jgi:alpha-tubulin suppressor-like RCC1 family protein
MTMLMVSGCVDFEQEQAAYCMRNSAKCSDPTPSFLGALQVSSRGKHILARSLDNSVFAWGVNDSYQIGDGTTDPRTRPTRIPTLSGVTSVAAGGYHSLAIGGGGEVFIWGVAGPGEPRKLPTKVSNLDFIVAIAAGVDFSLALHQTGGVLAWGNNLAGKDSLEPTKVLGLPEIAYNEGNEGTLAAGNAHALALDREGNVWAWGDNSKGQLGRTGPGSSTPTKVGLSQKIKFIAAGGAHSLAVDINGHVWAWGDNQFGQLGYPASSTPQTTPVRVQGTTAIIKVAAGDKHSLALNTGGEIMAWGDDEWGQLGNSPPGKGTAIPERVPHRTRVRSIAAGSLHSLAIEADNVLSAWGANPGGLLGVPPENGEVVYAPAFVVSP